MKALTTQLQTMSDEDDESDESDSDTEANKSGKDKKKKSKDAAHGKPGVYVPPKLSAVHYDGEDTKAERARKQLERARKRTLK